MAVCTVDGVRRWDFLWKITLNNRIASKLTSVRNQGILGLRENIPVFKWVFVKEIICEKLL